MTLLRADRRLRQRANGTVLIGGSPTTLLRISEAASALITSWFGGQPVGPAPAEQALAQRLLDNGMAHPVADGPPSPLHVIIPVRRDPKGLAATLDALGLAENQVTVVHDDGLTPMGPAAGRNLGLSQLGPEPAVVAFVDAGVTIAGDELAELSRHFADPDVVAVAPRVASAQRSDLVARYDKNNSPLDLGPDPGTVGVGRRISYVPTACLLLRRSALAARQLVEAVQFDESMRYGEDVDLLWRLEAAGGVIRYEPSVVALHQPRMGLLAMCKQRFGYGTAAGPLAERHGSAVAPLRLNPWSGAIVALIATGHPLIALLGAGAAAEALARKLPAALPDRRIEALRLSGSGHVASIRHSGEFVTRVAWPLAAELPALGLIGWLRGPSRQPLDLLLGPLDDASYGSGVLWASAKRLRTRWPAVVPVIMRSR